MYEKARRIAISENSANHSMEMRNPGLSPEIAILTHKEWVKSLNRSIEH